MRERGRTILYYVLVSAWVAFTVSLATWWLIFGLRQVERIRGLDHTVAPRLEREHRMLVLEGAVLLASLIGAGAALLLAVRRERERHRQVGEFFTAFTHDLKTALASLRLQAESLEEDLGPDRMNPALQRLLKDSVRLQLQLENALLLAQRPSGLLIIEPVSVGQIIDTVRHHWPELEIVLEEDAVVEADLRALESVVRNILQNAVIHGKADRVRIRLERKPASRLMVLFEDNGQGPPAGLVAIGEPFLRPSATSGTGIGLYIARQLMSRMGGGLDVRSGSERGFVVAVEIPARSS